MFFCCQLKNLLCKPKVAMDVAGFWSKVREEGDAVRVKLDGNYFSIEALDVPGQYRVEQYSPLDEEERVEHTFRFPTHFNAWLSKVLTTSQPEFL